MVTFKTDNRDVEAALHELHGLVLAAGGFLHEKLAVCCQHGDFWLESALPPDSDDVLVALSEACMAPERDFELAIDKDNQIILKSHSLDDGRLAILQVMLRLYNLTGKMAAFRVGWPIEAFQDDTPTMERLLQGRSNTMVARMFQDARGMDNLKPLVIENFLKTRTLNYGDGIDAMMPFMEYANHHIRAAEYLSAAPGHDGTVKALTNSKPEAGSDQCYGRYTMADALDTYLIMGFADRAQFVVRSIPVALDLGEAGKIEVDAKMSGPEKGPVENKMAAQGIYLPRLVADSPGFLKISWLVIPGSANPNALRKVLGFMIQRLAPGVGSEKMKVLLQKCEKEVLSANISFYEDLRGFLAGKAETPAIKEAKAMAGIQLSVLKTYQPLG